MRKCLVLCFTLLWLAGCAAPARQAHSVPKREEAAGNRLSEQFLAASPEPTSYPMNADVKLTAVVPESYAGENAANAFYQALEEQTGVSVRYTFLPEDGFSNGQIYEVVSMDPPDLMWTGDTALTDSLPEDLLELDGYLPKFAPNYLEWITRDRETLSAVLPDEGPILQFYTLWEEPRAEALYGPVIRRDLLERYNMPLPETYADWESFLRAAKSDVSQPLNLNYGAMNEGNWLSAGYEVSVAFGSGDYGFYQVDGMVKYGPLEPEYTALMTMLSDWYQEGLIGSKFLDFKDFGGSDYLLKQAMGESAIFFLTGGSRLASLEAVSEVEGFSAALLPDPVMEPEQETHLAPQRTEAVRSGGFSILASCEEPEAAVRFVDFFYSPEGIRLCNLGTEDVTWEQGKGGPEFTEAARNSDLLNANTNPALVGVYTRQRQVYELDPVVLEQQEIWLTRKDSSWHLPFSVFELKYQLEYRRGEDTDLELYMEDVRTYASAATLQFIVGERPLSEIPAMQEELRDMGAEECLCTLQEALDSYYAR